MPGKTFNEKYGLWALVAGAAEGLGEAYTTALAKKGINVIMVDKKAESLAALAKKVELEFGIKTKQLHLDLCDANAFEKIMTSVSEVSCKLLIYNAAYSLIKPFVKYSEEELENFIDVNARTQIKLVHRFARYLVEKKELGGILLMSSLAGLIGMQLVAPYAATKAFAWNLAEALHFELKNYNIDVMACIAGTTATPTYLSTTPKYGLFKPSVMNAEDVAEKALEKLGKSTLFIPGFSNRLNYFLLTRLMPRKMASSIANKTMFEMYKHRIDGD